MVEIQSAPNRKLQNGPAVKNGRIRVKDRKIWFELRKYGGPTFRDPYLEIRQTCVNMHKIEWLTREARSGKSKSERGKVSFMGSSNPDFCLSLSS